MNHTLKSRGAAYSPKNLTRIDPNSTAGIGVAVCSCDWVSEILPSGRARKAAHAAHKREAEQPTVSEAEIEGWAEADEDREARHQKLAIRRADEAARDAEEQRISPTRKMDADKTGEEILNPQAIADQLEKTGHVEVTDGTIDEPATRTFDWRGNYSIVFAPGSIELAKAYGLETSQKNVSAVLRQVKVTGDPSHVDAVLEAFEELQKDAMDHLHAWQKAHRAGRSELTDMQKFLEHRAVLEQFITDFIAEVRP